MFGIVFAIEEFYLRSNHLDTETGQKGSNKDLVVCSQWLEECFMESTLDHLSIIVVAADLLKNARSKFSQPYLKRRDNNPATVECSSRTMICQTHPWGVPKSRYSSGKARTSVQMNIYGLSLKSSLCQESWAISDNRIPAAFMAMMRIRCKLLTRTGFETNKFKQHAHSLFSPPLQLKACSVFSNRC